ncbi:MAG: PBP1A family penicillin-binding protein [Candidatus Abyssubacteria bacterium]
MLLLAVAGACLGCALGLGLGLSRDLPQIANLESFKPMLSSVVRSADGQIIAEFGIEKRQRTSLTRIPKELQQAIIAVEDQRFHMHFGVNPAGILRAAYVNAKAGQVVQGGSTITQQLARNLFLTRRRDFSRKLRETILALQIERKYTKEQILELYLNQIYLGHGAYGVEEAAQMYFGKHVEDLSLAQCALLAALPKAPNKYSPKNDPMAARSRRNLVLDLMYKEGYITKEQCITAKFEPIILSTSLSKKDQVGPYFVEYVRQLVMERYGYDMLYKGGFQIHTTLDVELQQAADKLVAEGLAEYERTQHGRADAHPETIPGQAELDTVPEELATNVVQAALVAIEPATGEIRAMVGGRDFEKSEFNRATQAKRQPGSGFKPFIWAAALESGMTPSDRLVDAPIVFHYRDKVWEPQNYEERFYGPTTLREALEHSRNIIAIKLMNQLGVSPVISLAHRMGIKSYLQPNLSLALGSTGVTPLEITASYATFANSGIYREPTAILKITGPDGEIIEERQIRETVTLSEQTAYIMTHMMQGVIERGTGREAKALGRPAAGKTGTTNDCTDAWFIGYTPQLVTGVWVGFDDMRSLGAKQTGGRVAAPIWTRFMKAALADKPIKDFPVPHGIEFVKIHPGSGLLAPPGSRETLTVPFLEGTAPTKYHDPSEEERLAEDIMHIFSSDLQL